MDIKPLLEVHTKLKAKPGLVLCDIDGCCIDPEERVQYLLAGDELAYIQGHATDKPIAAGAMVYALLMQVQMLRVVFITARAEVQRKVTEAQLRALFGPDAQFDLWMRANDDRRHDSHVKLHLLELNGRVPADVFLAFDDRPSMVQAYRDVGIVAYQTAEGY